MLPTSQNHFTTHSMRIEVVQVKSHIRQLVQTIYSAVSNNPRKLNQKFMKFTENLIKFFN